MARPISTARSCLREHLCLRQGGNPSGTAQDSWRLCPRAIEALHGTEEGDDTIFYAQPRIYNWIAWTRAKRQHDALHSSLSEARKKLDEERDTLRHKKDQLDAQKQTWQSSAAQYHDRGEKRGARQVPQWLVVLKATLWSLGGLALAWLLGPLLPPLYLVLPAGAWIAAFLYYRHRRFHPGYDQFKSQENTRFAVGSDRPKVEIPTTPTLLPPPEEK